MNVFCDWKINRKNIKARIILLFFRIANIGAKNKFLFLVFIPYLIWYRFFFEWILSCEIPYKTKIGKNLSLYHGYALVINDGTIIGENCTLRHCTTIGNKKLTDGVFSDSPIIGNNVDIGSNVCIIGPVKIGNNVKVGAGTIITKDIPANSIVVGNPVRILEQNR